MRAVVQRVTRATVREVTTGEVLGSLEQGRDGQDTLGLCVLLGIGNGDTRAEAAFLADKIAGLRIFSDTAPDGSRIGNMNRSLRDVDGSLLVISQFTLYADTSRGRRPSFIDAMSPAEAQALYEHFVAILREKGYRVATGRFGAMMAVELCNDGPVTIWLDTADAGGGRDKRATQPKSPAQEGA
jgi:D-tyrosyl-tRNA(Tyr) deacylase